MQTDRTMPNADVPDTTKTSAGLLVGASLLEVLAMAHHPSVHTPHVSEAMQQIARYAGLSGSVHGLLMALLLMVLVGFWEFAARRGLHRPVIRIGMVAYGAGTVMMLGAALVSGFILADVAAIMPRTSSIDLDVDGHLLVLCRILNQACANAGAVAMSVGIAAWSLDLWRERGSARSLGLLGLCVGVLPCVALMSGLLRLDVPGVTQVVALQAAWNVAVGVWLWRRTTPPIANRPPARSAA